MTKTKIRKLGSWFSICAFVALGSTAMADNRDLGFRCSIAPRDQLGLVVWAITLCALQVVLYLVLGKEKDVKRNEWA